jgi:hypothetical protein
MEWLRQKLVEIVSGEFCMELFRGFLGDFKQKKRANLAEHPFKHK